MKKTLIALLAAVIAAGTATAVSAWDENADYVKLGEITAAAYPASPSTGLPEVTSGQLLKGTVFTSTNEQGIQCDGANSADHMFDANAQTHYKHAENGWAGLILDQAYELTEVRVAPNPDLEAGALFNFWLQGSNDGENWVNIIIMRQDAHGNDYHIFTPQTVTDQRYIDAGYKARTDESIHWLADGGSYSMYRVVSGSVGELELYGNPAPATELDAEKASILNIATATWYPYITHVRADAPVKNAVDGALVGTIIGGGGIWNKATYEKAFDNNNKTCFDPSLEGPECWVGMMFDEPHALTEVRVLPKRGVYTDIIYGSFQGSLDGHNWVELASFSEADAPSKQDWVTKTITDTNGYIYFRYLSTADCQSSCAELLMFGAPAAAAEPFTVDPVIATTYKYTGPLYIHGTKNTVVAGEISGTPICGDGFFGWRSRNLGTETSFDGIFDAGTGYGTIPRLNGPQYWHGLMADTPTAVSSVKIYTGNTFVDPYLFQGSVDGINWVTLAEFTAADVKAADDTYTKEISDTNVYGYFRVMNPDDNHPACDLGTVEVQIFAAAAVAPETNAPETAAPETEAPVVTPEETDAPVVTPTETTAPAETEEPTAPQTFDFGVVAAVTAIVSAAGYALTKKRK